MIDLFSSRFDVVGVVNGEGAHEHAQTFVARGVLLDRIVAHTTGIKAFTFHAFNVTIGQHVGHVVGQITEVDEAPEGEKGDQKRPDGEIPGHRARCGVDGADIP